MIPLIDPEFQAQIPALSEDEFTQLSQNIAADGCRDPLSIWDGRLIDGHNRFQICQSLGLPFKTVDIDLPDREAVKDWIDANQLGRRNLKPDQVSLLRGNRYLRAKKRQGALFGNENAVKQTSNEIDENQSGRSAHFVSSVNDPSKTAEILGAQYGVHESTIRRDAKRAEFVAALPADQQRAILDGDKKIAAVKREIRKEEVKKIVATPEAKYRVIYADPPWSYNDKADEGAIQSGGAEKHYPSMTIGELCAVPVREWCESDAVLFLWVTAPLLSACWPIITAWGFTYKASFVWDKIKHNMGHYNSVRHEMLLICTRGSCMPEVSELIDSVQSIERTTHSKKPHEFRTIIETLYPHGKRLEMFAREDRVGWNSWGNEV